MRQLPQCLQIILRSAIKDTLIGWNGHQSGPVWHELLSISLMRLGLWSPSCWLQDCPCFSVQVGKSTRTLKEQAGLPSLGSHLYLSFVSVLAVSSLHPPPFEGEMTQCGNRMAQLAPAAALSSSSISGKSMNILIL